MKFNCEQSVLNAHLSIVNRAVPSRPTQPILANIKLVADKANQTISLTAFDLAVGIESIMSAEVEESGAIALPSKLLSDIISRLPNGAIAFESMGDYQMRITSLSGSYSVRGLDVSEFPELPKLESEKILIPVGALKSGLQGTLTASSSDETKQVLCGVRISSTENQLEFAATDGHRLAIATQEYQIKSELGATIPSRALREVERILSDEDEEIELQIDGAQAIFANDIYRLTCRTLEGQYPAYQQLIPREFERWVVCDRRQLIGALSRVEVIASQKNNIVVLKIESDRITISAESSEVGKASESMPAEMTGDPIDVAFSCRYLMDGLKVIASTEVKISINKAISPVILTPVGGDKMTYLLMPIQIRS